MWESGEFTLGGHKFYWEAKVCDLPSEYGIDNGRVSKLFVFKDGTSTYPVVAYDRGWDTKPKDDLVEKAYHYIMKRFIF